MHIRVGEGVTKLSGIVLLALLSTLAHGAKQSPASIPLNIDYSFLQQQLITRFYTRPNQEMEIWNDGQGCSRVTLSSPRVNGQNDLLRIRNQTVVDIGLPTTAGCVPVHQWSGTVETYHRPVVSNERTAVRFEFVDAQVYNSDNTPLQQGRALELLKQFAGPRLSDLSIDLQPVLTAIKRLLPALLPDENAANFSNTLDSLSFTTISAGQDSLEVILGFTVDNTLPVKRYEPPLTEAELDRWEQTSQQWDAFLTYTVKQIASHSQSAAVREALQNLLIEVRYDILTALSDPNTRTADPVRRMFVNVWTQLVPLLQEVSHELQGDLPLQYMTFIAAGDILQVLDKLGPDIGLEITADGLRRMARILGPDDSSDPLEYNLEIDPALRQLFDFGLPEAAEDPVSADKISWFIKSAYAATDSTALRRKLHNWVPPRNEISEYLSLVHQLLNETSIKTQKTGKLDSKYKKLYHNLLLATAWQESCWRQFIRKGKRVTTITSNTGSVGIMQVNRKVWRGLYDVGKLETDMTYNAQAGSEILLHYFRDYALKKEAGKSKAVDALARATYGAYNGGPRHLSRYRKSGTPERLRKIDASFWKKYQKIKSGDIKAVADCYGGTTGDVTGGKPLTKNSKLAKTPSRPAGVLQSNPNNYTIQLLSSRNEDQVSSYIQKHNLKGKAEYFTYRHNNETWYALVYGSFTTRGDAETRAQSLQKTMGLSGTWVRQISSILKIAK
jgi:hypothetical protein